MIEQLLPPEVVVVEKFGDRPNEPVFPGEEHLVARTVESRRREIVTARRCAREALATLGYAPAPIPRGRCGAPEWPTGAIGSITHCSRFRAAAVAPATAFASIGIDAEPHGPLPPEVTFLVTAGREPAQLDELCHWDPSVHWGRVLFSAKESVYKAWFPLTDRWLGFEEAELDIDPAAGEFRARLLVDGARTDGGPPLTVMAGRFLVTRELVATSVAVAR